ncbi:kinase-like domain-containing protein [Trametes elegans]|nr:kinase-like domain-containing protein [Trametes elegans]
MSQEKYPEPPWYVHADDGSITPSGVPDLLRTHPALRRRGLVPAAPFKPGVVFRTDPSNSPEYVIKILDTRSQELTIYERLLRLNVSSPNHTAPCEITQEGHPLLIMPMLTPVELRHGRRWTIDNLLEVFFQLVEGIEFLHNQHIAHLDLCPDNVMMMHPYEARLYPYAVPKKIYIIDYGESQQFQQGPGIQHAITLPPSQVDPPRGLHQFDPYSWDMYCLGHIFLDVSDNYRGRLPWFIHWYIQWVLGDERGCSAVCRCRPTARRARRVLSVLRWATYVGDVFSSVLQSARRAFALP